MDTDNSGAVVDDGDVGGVNNIGNAVSTASLDPASDAAAVGAHVSAELLPRKRPTQERSQRKFDALLASARELLTEVGFESFTCEEVAQRAEVPIGTLYQFFANKYVIVCELDRQDLIAVFAELREFASEIPSLDWVRFLENFVDHLATLWRGDPSRRAVWLAVQATPATRATAAVHERALANQVVRVLAPLTPAPVRNRRKLMAEVLVHVVYSMLNFSVQENQDPERVTEELKAMMVAYLLEAERSAHAALPQE